MSHYHGNKVSGYQQCFLIETAIRIVKQWKKSIGYCFVPEFNYAQKSHTCPLLVCFSFSAIFAGPRFVEIQNFVTKAKQCNDFSLLFFYLAITNSSRTILAPSPINFCTSSDPETLMNVHSVWCATARASSVLPVPGGPYSNTPWKKQLFRMKYYKVGFTNRVSLLDVTVKPSQAYPPRFY